MLPRNDPDRIRIVFNDHRLVLQRRVVLQGNSWADFETGNERVRVSHDERSVAEGRRPERVFS